MTRLPYILPRARTRETDSKWPRHDVSWLSVVVLVKSFLDVYRDIRLLHLRNALSGYRNRSRTLSKANSTKAFCNQSLAASASRQREWSDSQVVREAKALGISEFPSLKDVHEKTPWVGRVGEKLSLHRYSTTPLPIFSRAQRFSDLVSIMLGQRIGAP
jgi:hypothetical protein